MLLSMQGEFESGMELAERAYQLDPCNWWADWNLAEVQYLCHRFQDALDTIAKSRNAPGFIRIYSTAANVRLGRIDAARQSLQTYLGECRESMRAMPRSIDDWLRYTADTAPFADPQINQEIIDCLVQAGLEDTLTTTSTPADASEYPSIAVLPFTNLSGDAEQEYFSDGITASIILGLGGFKGLAVKSQNSSFAYRHSKLSSVEIAMALKADYLVEGSIRTSRNQVRLSVQLIEANSDNQIWANNSTSN